MMDKLVRGVKALGISLTTQQIEQFEQYYRLLTDWNKRVNLTGITDYEEVQLKHFLDSLTLILAADFRDGFDIIDIGTGGGFPGIPLKIAFPNLKMALLEATTKKTIFLKQVVDDLALENVTVIAERAETVAHNTQHRENYDIAISRAVTALPTLMELMLPFCKIGGECIVLKKGVIEGEVEQAEKAIALMGGKLREVKAVALKELDDNRWLVIIDKVKSTPQNYPRRPGIPRKRPII